MADLTWLFAFYSPEYGVNWNLAISYAVLFFLLKGLFPKVLNKIADKIVVLLDKLPLLKDTTLDNELFCTIRQHLTTKVRAKMGEARMLKLEYHEKIAKALETKNGAEVKNLSRELRDKLEALSKGIKDEFFTDSEDLLWMKLIERYGDKARACKWVFEKIKALVEELKKPDHPSTSALIARFIFKAGGELGKESAPAVPASSP